MAADGRNVLIMAGGTGGHVFPALACAREFQARGYSVHWLGTPRGIENELVPQAGLQLHLIQVTGLRGKGKLSLLASDTSELVLQDVRLPADAILPGSGGLKSPLMCLTQARYGISWGAIGAAMACFEEAVRYAGTRVMFDRPIGGFRGRLAETARLRHLAAEKGMLLTVAHIHRPDI